MNTDRIAFKSAGAVPPQIAKRRALAESAAADRPCAVCGRTTTQAEKIDYACCREAG